MRVDESYYEGIDYREKLEALGHKTAYQGGVAKVYTENEVYGVGSFCFDEPNFLFCKLYHHCN